MAKSLALLNMVVIAILANHAAILHLQEFGITPSKSH
jgi:hypothetical protein